MNIGKITRNLILGGTLAATAGGYFNGHVTHGEEINQIKYDIYNNTPDSAFWADYERTYMSKAAMYDHLNIHSYEEYLEDYMNSAEQNDIFHVFGRLEYWQGVQKKARELQQSMRNIAERVKERAYNKYLYSQLSDNECKKFINSQKFIDFIKNQEILKEDFLRSNPNYKLIQRTDALIGLLSDDNKFTNLDEVQAVATREIPYREKAYKEVEFLERKDNGKGHSLVRSYKKVPYDRNPYKDIKCFFRVEEKCRGYKVLVCEKYADPNK